MEQRDSCRQGSECRELQIQGPEDSGTSNFSGIARGCMWVLLHPIHAPVHPSWTCLPIAGQNMHVSLYCNKTCNTTYVDYLHEIVPRLYYTINSATCILL